MVNEFVRGRQITAVMIGTNERDWREIGVGKCCLKTSGVWSLQGATVIL